MSDSLLDFLDKSVPTWLFLLGLVLQGLALASHFNRWLGGLAEELAQLRRLSECNWDDREQCAQLDEILKELKNLRRGH